MPGRVFVGDIKAVNAAVSGYVERGYAVEQVPRNDGKRSIASSGPPSRCRSTSSLAKNSYLPARIATRRSECVSPGPTRRWSRHRTGCQRNRARSTWSFTAKSTRFTVTASHGKLEIDHRALAKYIEKSGATYKRIRLISCSTGKHPKGAAQHLANKLGVTVRAPSDFPGSTRWDDDDRPVRRPQHRPLGRVHAAEVGIQIPRRARNRITHLA